MNVCRYHLQEAGATPVQEIAYALATAIGVLDAVRDSGQVPPERFPEVVRLDLVLRQRRHPLRRGDLQDAGASPSCGTASARERYGVTDPKAPPLPLRRAGQLARPHRGAAREQRAAHRARDARRHAVEAGPGPRRSSCRRGTRRSACPARGTSSGRCACSRCWPSRPTCSSTSDIFDGSHVVEARTAELRDAAQAELDDVLALGGAFEAIDELKGRLVRVDGRADPAHRVGRADRGRRQRFTETEPSPLGGEPSRSSQVDPAVEAEMVADVERVAGRPRRRRGAARARRAAARRPSGTDNLMPATIALAHAGGTTGEWAGALREVFGEYRAPTGVRAAAGGRSDELAAVAAQGQGPAGRPAPAPRGQARPRRPLQRRRADRGRGPRRRHGGHLLGHPPHARADRGLGTRRGRRRDRPVDPVGQPPRARARGARRLRRGGASTRRSWSAGSSPRTTGDELLAAGVARRLHAEGLRARPDHGRDRRLHRGAARRGLRRTARLPARRLAAPAGAAQGAAVVVAAGGGAAGGTVRRWPAWILFGSVMPLAAARSAMAMPSLSAMPCRVSPCCTS